MTALREVRRVVLPDEAVTANTAMVSPRGTVTLLSYRAGKVWVVSPDSDVVVSRTDTTGLAAAYSGDDHTLRTVSVAGVLRVYGPVGDSGSSARLPWRMIVRDGVYHDSTWILGVVDSGGAYLAVSVTADGQAGELFRESRQAANAYDERPFTLKLGRDFITITRARAPYTVFRVDRAGTSVLGEPRDLRKCDRAARKRSGMDPLWYAIGTVPSPRGWVQTIADFRSDGRCIVTYGATGAWERTSFVPALIGFIGYADVTRTLIALQRTNRLELVFFRASGE